ncbi:hypothetical protein [Paenibacillus kribbensis]|uniref:hypothetical protein n=1 Tax=Paenibacillus kribbensis TaxID=172713 RepID=UPI000837BF25|nr:hypothetical protein [Paenibacillus kribbensis]
MKIIRNKEELEGTCYIEILPGRYLGQCWSDTSIFLTEELFGFIEKSVESEHSTYDHYAFNEIQKETWWSILGRLERVINLLEGQPKMNTLKEHIGFYFGYSENEFKKDYENNIEKLRELIKEFQTWIKEQLRSQDYISILGI